MNEFGTANFTARHLLGSICCLFALWINLTDSQIIPGMHASGIVWNQAQGVSTAQVSSCGSFLTEEGLSQASRGLPRKLYACSSDRIGSVPYRQASRRDWYRITWNIVLPVGNRAGMHTSLSWNTTLSFSQAVHVGRVDGSHLAGGVMSAPRMSMKHIFHGTARFESFAGYRAPLVSFTFEFFVDTPIHITNPAPPKVTSVLVGCEGCQNRFYLEPQTDHGPSGPVPGSPLSGSQLRAGEFPQEGDDDSDDDSSIGIGLGVTFPILILIAIAAILIYRRVRQSAGEQSAEKNPQGKGSKVTAEPGRRFADFRLLVAAGLGRMMDRLRSISLPERLSLSSTRSEAAQKSPDAGPVGDQQRENEPRERLGSVASYDDVVCLGISQTVNQRHKDVSPCNTLYQYHDEPRNAETEMQYFDKTIASMPTTDHYNTSTDTVVHNTSAS